MNQAETTPLLSNGTTTAGHKTKNPMDVSSSFPPLASSSPPHPEASASVWSKIFFFWCNPLLDLGASRVLDKGDAWPLTPETECGPCTQDLLTHWDGTTSLFTAFTHLYGLKYFSIGLLLATGYACDLFGPIVLEQVVSILTENTDLSRAWGWLGALFLSRILKSVCFAHFFFLAQVIMLRFTSALKGFVYRKSFRLSAASRARKSTGDIVNIYTTDVINIIAAAFFIHYMWVLPLEILIIAGMLYRVVGAAMFAGFAVIVVVLGCNNVLAKIQSRTFETIMRVKDERMKVVTELFGAMQIVKLNAWEQRFNTKLMTVRTEELKYIWHYMVIGGLNIFLLWGAPVFVSTAVFAVYALVLQETLTATKMFTAIALFRLLQDPLRQLPSYITGLIQAGVSIKRLKAFASMPERDPTAVCTPDTHPKLSETFEASDTIVSIQSGTFRWENAPENTEDTNETGSVSASTTSSSAISLSPPVFSNIALSIQRGEFVVMHGAVGSGKSSLCAALLGDMVIDAKTVVYVGGSLAYCPQQSWIQHATLRNNILFGTAYDPILYAKVIDACGLTTDFAAFPAGDATEVGEKGLNLSGGQKARVALARACYSNADIYLFDAPLAALDAIVAKEIFTKCLVGLLAHKTRILITHNPDIIAAADVGITRVIELGKGNLATTATRSISSLGNSDTSASYLVSPLPPSSRTARLNSQKAAAAAKSIHTKAVTLPLFPITAVTMPSLAASELLDVFAPLTRKASSFVAAQGNPRTSLSDTVTPQGQLVSDEVMESGRVSGHVFSIYFNALGGVPTLVFLLVVQTLWQVLQIGSDFWISAWTAQSADVQRENVASNLTMYMVLALGGAVMVLARTLTISYQGIKGAAKMFDAMTAALLQAPMSFFDANPLGRQLNRYADDVSNVDLRLPFACGSMLANAFSLGATLLTAAVLTRALGLLILPMLYIYIKLGSFYLATARELQRLQKVTQSPVLAHIGESFEGASVIRAFDATSRFIRTNEAIIDTNNSNQFATFACAEWFALRMQLLGGVVLFIVTGSLVSMRSLLSAGIVGLAFNYALMVDQGLESMIQIWSMIETSMISPERLAEYMAIEQEAPHLIPATQPADSWPPAGAVTFSNVSFRYTHTSDLVLKDVSFSAAPGEKIGIVGRTGAGKSSLTMALFRMHELAAGSVTIDGINIATLGLSTLRARLCIITQSPVLFKGTLRNYLDPFDEVTDAALWVALAKVNLTRTVSSMPAQLLAPLDANGENFSMGERQLLCMARALLSRAKVVVMDEATAAIDQATDTLLQKVIREEFKHSTVITIAHRLDTVWDADRIMVLDMGRIVELDAPKNLLAKGKGHFYDLAKEGGYLDRK